eukprot:4156620-Amphidinium_carterae.1
MACGQDPAASTTLRKWARSSIAVSGKSLSSAILQRSTPLALPRGQCRMTDLNSPVPQEDCDAALAGKVVFPGCHSLLQASSSA